jgi:hypothetical protein
VRSTEGAMGRNVQRRVEVAAAGQRRRKTVVLEEIHQEGCARVGVLKKRLGGVTGRTWGRSRGDALTARYRIILTRCRT